MSTKKNGKASESKSLSIEVNGKLTCEVKDGYLVIAAPISVAPSNSGKTMLIVSTHGNVKTDVEYEGQQVTLSVNAYYKPSK